MEKKEIRATLASCRVTCTGCTNDVICSLKFVRSACTRVFFLLRGRDGWLMFETTWLEFCWYFISFSAVHIEWIGLIDVVKLFCTVSSYWYMHSISITYNHYRQLLLLHIIFTLHPWHSFISNFHSRRLHTVATYAFACSCARTSVHGNTTMTM